MRVLAAFILTMAATGMAQGSSFVVMGETAPAATPSIITLGAPAPARQTGQPSAQGARFVETPLETPSIIALGEPLPEVTFEKVAAIPRRGPNFQPLVIRGGIAGDAFAPAIPPKDTAAPSQQAAASKGDAPAPPPAPAAPPAYLPPNGYGKHRQ
ncbi:hypothetical protein [Mesorhizobium sp. A623]